MELEKALFERRSVRSYTSATVEREKLDYVLKAAAYAPSAMNNQDRTFIAVTDKNALARLNAAVESVSDEATRARIKGRSADGKFDFFYSAPVLILVCAKKDGLCPAQDCSVALENMFLAALDAGLGSCWINQLLGKSDLPELNALLKEFGMKDGYAVYGCCALGYAAVKPGISVPKSNEIIII